MEDIKVLKLKQRKLKSVEYTTEYDKSSVFVLNTIDNEKLDADSEFIIGSISKVFTALTLLKLQENGELSLQDKCGKYIKDIIEVKNTKIIELINHVSGLKRAWEEEKIIIKGLDYSYPVHGERKIYTSAEEGLLEKTNLMVEGQKGTYLYSSIGYRILGTIIEKITGKRCDLAVKELILDPLDMTHTSMKEPNITMYNRHLIKLQEIDYMRRSLSISTGGFKSSINDLIKMNKLPSLFSKKSLKELKTFYFYKRGGISHNGLLFNCDSNFSIKFDEEWNCNSIRIMFQTGQCL
jgi:CubicO group peptidase (beta-lactamase class C family)